MTVVGSNITAFLSQGLAASRPTTPNAQSETLSLYYATDTKVLSCYDWNAAAWFTIRTSQTAIYDLLVNFSGVPAVSQKWTHIASEAFTLPASLTGSEAVIATNPTSTLTVALAKNGSSIGSIAYSTLGAPTFMFASQVSFAIGDVLTATCPASPDATGADIAFTLKGTSP